MSSLVYVASNNGNSTLAGSLTALSTSFTVYTGQGSRFPVINDGGVDRNQYTKITLQKADGTKETVHVVRHDTGSDSFTIGVPGTVTGSVSGRGQEGSSATTWSIGDVVSCRPTADLMEEAVNLGAKIAASDEKTALHDDDKIGVSDSEASNLTKYSTWANIKSLLTTVFNALYLPLTGGTVSGNVAVNGHVTLGAGKTLVYEGTTDDAFELTVSGGEPTADRTQTHPDMTGTLSVQARGADVASASTINLTTATGDIVDVTGTTAITAVTLADGLERQVRFTGALTLTHGASLVLPGAANITTEAGDFATFRGYAAGVVRCTAYATASGRSVAIGGVVQTVEATPILSVVTCPTAIPYDDTIPQKTEGNEVITVQITPVSASNRLRIESEAICCITTDGYTTMALFQDSVASALAIDTCYDRNHAPDKRTIVHEMAAGTTSLITFKIRVGPSVGTVYVNGHSSGVRIFGGVSAARLRVTEIKA